MLKGVTVRLTLLPRNQRSFSCAGGVYDGLGDSHMSLQCHQNALAIAEATGDLDAQAMACCFIGKVCVPPLEGQSTWRPTSRISAHCERETRNFPQVRHRKRGLVKSTVVSAHSAPLLVWARHRGHRHWPRRPASDTKQGRRLHSFFASAFSVPCRTRNATTTPHCGFGWHGDRWPRCRRWAEAQGGACCGPNSRRVSAVLLRQNARYTGCAGVGSLFLTALSPRRCCRRLRRRRTVVHDVC